MGKPSLRRNGVSPKKPFQPAHGSDFDIEPHLVEARTRGFLVRVVAVMIASAVGLTGLHGLLTGDYRALTGVWTVAGPISGAIMAYFFGAQRRE